SGCESTGRASGGPGAQGLERGGLEVRGQAEPLEPVHEVVGEQEQMEVGLVGEEGTAGETAQGRVPFEFVDEQFHAGAVVVEAPEVERLEREVRDQNLVVVLPKLEEGQLLGRVLRLGPTDDDETIGLRPAGRLVPKLGDLDASTGAPVAQVRELALDRGREPGDDHEAGSPSFEPLDQLVVVKAFVCADNRERDPGRDLREARREQIEGPAGRMHVAWSSSPCQKSLVWPSKQSNG